MAKTLEGVEFYLTKVSIQSESIDIDKLSLIIERVLRKGDTLFKWQSDLFVAIVAPVPGVGKAIRRIQAVIKDEMIEARALLVAEPFPPSLQEAADRVINGQVRIRERPVGSKETPGDISSGQK